MHASIVAYAKVAIGNRLPATVQRSNKRARMRAQTSLGFCADLKDLGQWCQPLRNALPLSLTQRL